jgi:HEXXH motif-containing protein
MSLYNLHRITPGLLAELASGDISADMAQRLREVRLSKHKILLEAVRRSAESVGRSGELAESLSLLRRVEACRPDVLDEILGLPHVGGWAIDALRALAAASDSAKVGHGTADPGADLGYLSFIAAAAAIRADVPFELRASMCHGLICVPNLGFFTTPATSTQWCLRPGANGMPVLTAAEAHAEIQNATWAPAERVRVSADGVALDVTLDGRDPQLARYGLPTQSPGPDLHAAWHRVAADAWQVVVSADRAMAASLARFMQVIVPLDYANDGKPFSATSGWTPGAVALNLHTDPLALAENLVHEYQHLLLGLVEEIAPLVDPASNIAFYAPWRDDPRPPGGVLHGSFALLAVTRLWRQRRAICPEEEESHAQVEFARWRDATHDAAVALLASGALTEVGTGLASEIRKTLAEWKRDPVPADALARAAELNAEHRLRWQLAHDKTALRSHPRYTSSSGREVAR